jgi:serine/threonine-protein kinase
MPESNSARDLRQQLRQARSELEQCLRAGRGCRAEEIFARYPALAADEDSALEIIYSTEFTILELLGEDPSPAEYYARFPEHRQRLEELFHLHELVGGEEELGSPDCLDLAVQDGTDWGVEHFQVLESLGQHGSVVVLKARQLSCDRLVVVKMVAKGQTPEEELDRFRRGRDDQARLRHPNIVEVYDRGEDEDDVFFTMELGEGGTLAQRIDGRPLPADEAARIMHSLAGAVQYAHGRKIIHRDLKPANVVLAADGTPKITDFGLAKRLETESAGTRSGYLLGTPAYMAPEQADGQAAIDERTDVYGLGALLYETLTGQPPFQGKNDLDTILQVRRGRVVLPRRRNRAADRRLESICLRCLEWRPRRRYPSAGALANDLERWRSGRWPRAHRLPARTGRLVRRHPLLAVLLLFGLAVLTVPVVEYFTNPVRALRRAQARLAEGEEVTWIGKTGRPLFSRPLLPDGDEIICRSNDGAFVFGSRTISLLELVPDPMCSHYVFSASVRRESVDSRGEVGIYCLHSCQGPDHDPLNLEIGRHWYCVISFNDSPDADPGPSLTFQRLLQASRNPQFGPACSTIEYPRSREKVWHKLAVEVSPSEVRFQLDGRSRTTSRRDLHARAKILHDHFRRPPEPKPPFPPRSSLGLYAFWGSASFCNVVVKPIKPPAGE